MENLLFILLNVSKNFLSYKHFNLETVPTGSKKKSRQTCIIFLPKLNHHLHQRISSSLPNARKWPPPTRLTLPAVLWLFQQKEKRKKKESPSPLLVTFDTSKTIEQIAWYRARLAKFHRRDFGSAMKEASAEAVGRKREGWKALTFKGSRVVFTGTTRRRAEIRGIHWWSARGSPRPTSLFSGRTSWKRRATPPLSSFHRERSLRCSRRSVTR